MDPWKSISRPSRPYRNGPQNAIRHSQRATPVSLRHFRTGNERENDEKEVNPEMGSVGYQLVMEIHGIAGYES